MSTDSAFGIFEAAHTSAAEQQRTQREASDRLAAAVYDVKERFGDFLFGAANVTEFRDRVALTKTDMIKTVEPHVFPRTGVMRRICKQIENEFKDARPKQTRPSFRDYMQQVVKEKPENVVWTPEDGWVNGVGNPVGDPGEALNKKRKEGAEILDTDVTFAPSDDVMVPEGDFRGYLDEVDQGGPEKVDAHVFAGKHPRRHADVPGIAGAPEGPGIDTNGVMHSEVGFDQSMPISNVNIPGTIPAVGADGLPSPKKLGHVIGRFAAWCEKANLRPDLNALDHYSARMGDADYFTIVAGLQRTARGKKQQPLISLFPEELADIVPGVGSDDLLGPSNDPKDEHESVNRTADKNMFVFAPDGKSWLIQEQDPDSRHGPSAGGTGICARQRTAEGKHRDPWGAGVDEDTVVALPPGLESGVDFGDDEPRRYLKRQIPFGDEPQRPPRHQAAFRTAAPDYLQKADEALGNLLNQRAEEFQEQIAPLQQALQVVQQAEAEQQAANPFNVMPGGSIDVMPQPPAGAAPPGGDPGGGMPPGAQQGAPPDQGGGGMPPGGDPTGGGMPPGGPPPDQGGGQIPPEVAQQMMMQGSRREGADAVPEYGRSPNDFGHGQRVTIRPGTGDEIQHGLHGVVSYPGQQRVYIDMDQSGKRIPYRPEDVALAKKAVNDVDLRGPWSDIAYLQGDDYNDIADMGPDEMAQHLSRWDYGDDDNIRDEAPWGTKSRVYPVNIGGIDYVLSEDPGLGAGLSRRPLNRSAKKARARKGSPRIADVVADFDDWTAKRPQRGNLPNGTDSDLDEFARERGHGQRAMQKLRNHLFPNRNGSRTAAESIPVSGVPADHPDFFSGNEPRPQDTIQNLGGGWQQDLQHGDVFHPDYEGGVFPTDDNWVVKHDQRGDLRSGPFLSMDEGIKYLMSGGKPQYDLRRKSNRKQAWIGWGPGQPGARKVAGWDWDDHLNGYIASAPIKFACSCGNEHDTPSGYQRCRCGKAYNSYVIGTGGDRHEASAEKYLMREIPVRDGVIVANRRVSETQRNRDFRRRDDYDPDVGGSKKRSSRDFAKSFAHAYAARESAIHDVTEEGELGDGEDDGTPTMRKMPRDWAKRDPNGKWTAGKTSASSDKMALDHIENTVNHLDDNYDTLPVDEVRHWRDKAFSGAHNIYSNPDSDSESFRRAHDLLTRIDRLGR